MTGDFLVPQGILITCPQVEGTPTRLWWISLPGQVSLQNKDKDQRYHTVRADSASHGQGIMEQDTVGAFVLRLILLKSEPLAGRKPHDFKQLPVRPYTARPAQMLHNLFATFMLPEPPKAREGRKTPAFLECCEE